MRCRWSRDNSDEDSLTMVAVELDPNTKSYGLVRYHIPVSDNTSSKTGFQRSFQQLFHLQAQSFKVSSLTVSQNADVVVVATHDLAVFKSITQLKLFVWNQQESKYDFKWDFSMRSPLYKVVLSPLVTDSFSSAVHIVTSRADDAPKLAHLVWTPQQGTVEEHSIGSPTDLTRNQLEGIRPNVLYFSPLELEKDHGHCSSVKLVCSWHKLLPEDSQNNKPRAYSTFRSSTSVTPAVFLSWCYQRSLPYNFAGAMYPVGYRLVMESYLYSEREDEFDRVTDPSMGRRAPNLLQFTESPISKPRRRSKLPLSTDWISYNRPLDESIVPLDAVPETESADILPILSTCRITIIDGVLQIKPPSKARTALETWVMAQKSGHKKEPLLKSVGFDLREPQSQFSTRKNQIQKLESVMHSIQQSCMDTDLVEKRTAEQQCMMIERIVKAEYYNAVKRMRGREKMAARNQSKQALLVSLLKSSEEEKRLKAQQREMEEKAARLEVETLVSELVGIVCDNADKSISGDDDDTASSNCEADGSGGDDDEAANGAIADLNTNGTACADGESGMDVDADDVEATDGADEALDVCVDTDSRALVTMDVDTDGNGDEVAGSGDVECQPPTSPASAADF